MTQQRTYKIHVERDPAISGWGGFDEWTVPDLDSEQADYLLQQIDALVKRTCKMFKKDGGFTGSN